MTFIEFWNAHYGSLSLGTAVTAVFVANQLGPFVIHRHYHGKDK